MKKLISTIIICILLLIGCCTDQPMTPEETAEFEIWKNQLEKKTDESIKEMEASFKMVTEMNDEETANYMFMSDEEAYKMLKDYMKKENIK